MNFLKPCGTCPTTYPSTVRAILLWAEFDLTASVVGGCVRYDGAGERDCSDLDGIWVKVAITYSASCNEDDIWILTIDLSEYDGGPIFASGSGFITAPRDKVCWIEDFESSPVGIYSLTGSGSQCAVDVSDSVEIALPP